MKKKSYLNSHLKCLFFFFVSLLFFLTALFMLKTKITRSCLLRNIMPTFATVFLQKWPNNFFQAITKGIKKILKTCNCKYLCSSTLRSWYSLMDEYFRVFIQLYTDPAIAGYIVLCLSAYPWYFSSQSSSHHESAVINILQKLNYLWHTSTINSKIISQRIKITNVFKLLMG